MILTFLFVFVILSVTRSRANATIAGIAIGLSLTLVHVVAIPADGTSANPARSLGPTLFVGGAALSQLWVFILAPLIVLVRDVDPIVRVVLRVLFYASPVLYSINQGRIERLKFFYSANPIVGILDLFRAGVFPLEMDVTRVVVSCVETVLIFCVGVFVFARLERQVLKEI